MDVSHTGSFMKLSVTLCRDFVYSNLRVPHISSHPQVLKSFKRSVAIVPLITALAILVRRLGVPILQTLCRDCTSYHPCRECRKKISREPSNALSRLYL